MTDIPALPAPSAYDLAGRPGFLIRRLHQIHLAMFAEECAALGVTPVQFSVMTVIAAQPRLDQARIGHEAGIDRATLASVLARLEKRGLLRRFPCPDDRRLKRVVLSPGGAKLLERMKEPAQRAHDRTVAALPQAEREQFLLSLARLVNAGNAYGRAPLRLG